MPSAADHGFSQSVYDAYYTYRCPGLPAGPIANPGTEIMTATVEHPSTDYLYFFSDLKGTSTLPLIMMNLKA